jgi:hypothetical protein
MVRGQVHPEPETAVCTILMCVRVSVTRFASVSTGVRGLSLQRAGSPRRVSPPLPRRSG